MSTIYVKTYPDILPQDLPDVTDAVVKATQNFTFLTWKYSDSVNMRTYFFGGPHHAGIASYYNKRVSIYDSAKQFVLLDRTEVQARHARLQDFNRTRTILQDTLNASWGNGQLAEQYMDCAARNRVSVKQLKVCSSLILDCLDGFNMSRKSELQKFSQHSIINMCTVTSDPEELHSFITTLNNTTVAHLMHQRSQ